MTARAGLGALAVVLLGLSACSTDVGTAGCQTTVEVRLAGTALTLLPDARLLPIGSGFVLMGSDGTALRWATLSANGTLGAEQSYVLPAEATTPFYAVAGAVAPADTVLVGFVAPNGSDAELHFISVPADGTAAGAPGPAVVTVAGGAAAPLAVALGTSRDGMDAGLTWVDPVAGEARFAFVNGLGVLTSAPITIDSAMTFSCLAVTSQTTVAGASFLVSFLRYDTAGGLPSWEKGEMSPDGSVATLKLSLALANTTMGCAVGVPTTGLNYALGWQDYSGSWLSTYTAPQTDAAGNVLAPAIVTSYPFVSATDFGGPDLQPPIVGLAPFGSDYGVAFARPHALELWRLSATGTRRSGALVFPSQEGNLGSVSTVTGAGGLVATYADYTASAGGSGRWFVDATCY